MDVMFFIEVVVTGLVSGMLYALVALGFVLIYKASGVFNFAQGVMVLFAAQTFVGLAELFHSTATGDIAYWLALIATIVTMIALAFFVERVVLRPLVNQPAITLFMATIALTYLIEGVSLMLWGSKPYILDLGVTDDPIDVNGVLIRKLDLVAVGAAAAMVLALGIFFQITKVGRALRAVADDHQAALSIGIPLNIMWVIVWSVAGLVALVAGLIWGAKLGVQFSISVLALKALPALILGGFTSIPGAILGGLIIGAGEKLAEVFLGPFLGGAIENWFAYVLALLFLFIRPQGLLGEKIIERV